MLRQRISTSLLFIVFLSLFVTSCSKSPDVRLTLCQDISRLILNSPENIEWKEHKAIMKGYEDLEIQLTYSLVQQNNQRLNHQASCFFSYEQDEIGAETFNTPTAAYSTYPTKMVLNGNTINKMKLYDLVNQVMLIQGKQAIKKVKDNVTVTREKAIETINQKIKDNQ